MHPDDALSTFESIYRDLGAFARERGRISEADTRANIIDRIIHEVLGWPRDAVHREVYSKAGYLDYELSRGIPLLVFEAKAEGEAFVIPYRKRAGAQRLKISGSLEKDKTIRAALEQTHDYCGDRGIRYGVTTNGYSFIIFRAITEGVSWRDGNAVIFSGPKIVETDFSTFRNLLSYEAVADGKLDEAFRHQISEVRELFTPIESIVDSDATYARNPINTSLRPYVDKFFGDIASQDTIEVLQKCYVYSRPVQTIDIELNLTIRDFVPAFATTVKQLRIHQDDEAGAIGSDIRDVAGAPKRKGSVVLLIGGIGSGKTTFLKRFFRVVAPELTLADGPAFRLHLDFLGAPDRVEELDAFLWSTASEALRVQEPGLIEKGTLERVFASKLALINKIFAADKTRLDAKVNDELLRLSLDPQAFTLAVLKYCSAYGKLPIVLFDNVDQLAVPIQTHIFTTAEHFANHLGCLSVLVVREESYSTAQMQKQLTAYTIRAYHLSSPSFRQMIRLRIDFATYHAASSNEQPELTVDSGALQYQSAEILEFFDLLRRSVFGRNHNIMRLIEAISFGNMRFALLLFNNFITSGATNMPKILEKFKGGGYTVPFHEFAKSVILGDYRFYRESRSLIGNLFRSTATRNASHLTSLRILSYLATSSRKHGSGDGFVDLQELITAFVDVFDNEDDCIKTVAKLIALNRQLAELDTRRTDTLVGAYAIRITTAGKYYLNYMVNAFSYLDLVWHDTPIGDRVVAEKLTRLIHSTDMEERFARVDLFLTYLETEEEKELKVVGIHVGGSGICGPFLPRVKQLFAKEKLDVRKRVRNAERAYGRSSRRPIRTAVPTDS